VRVSWDFTRSATPAFDTDYREKQELPAYHIVGSAVGRSGVGWRGGGTGTLRHGSPPPHKELRHVRYTRLRDHRHLVLLVVIVLVLVIVWRVKRWGDIGTSSIGSTLCLICLWDDWGFLVAARLPTSSSSCSHNPQSSSLSSLYPTDRMYTRCATNKSALCLHCQYLENWGHCVSCDCSMIACTVHLVFVR
jgi:hypothetical protein